ncbi:MAG: hypothetical protein UX89_C0016G0011 [Parcubacteria group bacterium GW2011_GWA2_47_16]|nr:MAG: hypothetical protein UX89_C0016G0011 [Parcubacteria group bacterium GW2011_GWA2_47_16]
MMEYLEHLRKKPLHYRKRVAVLIASTITVLILLIWLSTFNFVSDTNVLDSKTIAEELKPLEQIKASVIDFYASLKEMSSVLFEVPTSSVPNK